MLRDGYFGDTFDYDRDGHLDECERFQDFNEFAIQEEEREKREWDDLFDEQKDLTSDRFDDLDDMDWD